MDLLRRSSHFFPCRFSVRGMVLVEHLVGSGGGCSALKARVPSRL